MKIKFKKGDKVMFRPKYAKYTFVEREFAYKQGVVMDESDLPNVWMMDHAYGQPYNNILTAHQDDLVRINPGGKIETITN